jgi:integrase
LTFRGANTILSDFFVQLVDYSKIIQDKGDNPLIHLDSSEEINPFIGNIRLKDLKPDRIQQFYDFLQKQDTSEHAAHYVHKVLRAALNHAVKLKLLASNPCVGTTPPRPKQVEMKFYDEGQVQILLEAAYMYGDYFYPLYYLAVHTGMRQGELIGLKWEDVDWERRTIQVKRQVQHHKGGSYTFAKPKSKSGNRTIILGQQAIEILRVHLAKQRERRKDAGDKWVDINLIFPSKVGTPVTASNLRRAFRRILDVSGLPKIR